MDLLIFRSIYLSIHPSIYLFIFVPIYLSTYPPIYLSIHPSVHPSIWPSYLSICPKAFDPGRLQRDQCGGLPSETTSTKACKSGVVIEARGQENGHTAVCFVLSEKTDKTKRHRYGNVTLHLCAVRKNTHWHGRLSCWKMNRSETTQSPAFAYGPDDQTRVPRRHGNLGGACVWQQKL